MNIRVFAGGCGKIARPIGIPILTLGDAIPGAMGGGLWFANLMIAKQQQIPVLARALITVAGFVAAIVLLGGIAILQMK